MSGRGLRPGPCEITNAYSRDEGAKATLRLLNRHPDITAIAAANDLLALGAYDAVAKMEFKCPEDISIVGHNDMPLMDIVRPGLTTIRISHKEMGHVAADLLLQAIDQPGRSPRNIVLPPQLVIRQSTAALKR